MLPTHVNDFISLSLPKNHSISKIEQFFHGEDFFFFCEPFLSKLTTLIETEYSFKQGPFLEIFNNEKFLKQVLIISVTVILFSIEPTMMKRSREGSK